MMRPARARPIEFVPLTAGDLEGLARWLSEPHVQPWFYGRSVDRAFVEAEYFPVLAQSSSKRGFVIVTDGERVGYIETYRGEDHAAFFEALSVEPAGVAGLDLLIGEPGRLGRRLGTASIRLFTAEVIFGQEGVDRVVAGPDVRNRRSIAAFEAAGYKRRGLVQVPGDQAPALVMERSRPDAGRGIFRPAASD